MDMEQILKERFGLPGFRPGQKDIIASILSGRDTVAIMATGGGKSLCYQFPGALMPGMTVVVTPIISLMADQVRRLHELGLPAGYLSSAKSSREQDEDLRKLAAGDYQFVLVSPERLSSKKFRTALTKAGTVGLLAVDEAHCVSQWGHDFRPDYLKIGSFRKYLGQPPCIALTGTATDRVKHEIMHFLKMEDAAAFTFSFNRPNLRYLIYREENSMGKLDRLRYLLSRVDGSGIIYCGTRREVEFISQITEGWGLSCLPYHAGMPPELRNLHQDRWISGDVALISATNAFGMGIDKADVRFVIHFSMSASMENYYQEAGRAGRDGGTSLCIVLHSDDDERKIKRINALNNINPLITDEHRAHIQSMADSCSLYVSAASCRRQLIMHYFAEDYEKANCASCDICLQALHLHPDEQLLLPGPGQDSSIFDELRSLIGLNRSDSLQQTPVTSGTDSSSAERKKSADKRLQKLLRRFLQKNSFLRRRIFRQDRLTEKGRFLKSGEPLPLLLPELQHLPPLSENRLLVRFGTEEPGLDRRDLLRTQGILLPASPRKGAFDPEQYTLSVFSQYAGSPRQTASFLKVPQRCIPVFSPTNIPVSTYSLSSGSSSEYISAAATAVGRSHQSDPRLLAPSAAEEQT